MRHGPAVRRRKLGEELRRQRALAGLTSGEAAGRVGWHQSKVSRIETGRSAAKPADVVLLLDAYRVRDLELRQLLLALAEGVASGPRIWWSSYRDLLPPAYRDFISLEAEATGMRTLETTVVPGLLQTPDYARCVTSAALGSAARGRQVEALVDVRLARQTVLHGSRPLLLHAVLDEAVLRRKVGGPEVMAEQLRHLVEVGRLPHVRLQVLPFDSGVHIGVTGPFVIFSFSHGADLDVVVLDHLTSTLYLERKEDLRAYGEAFTTLEAGALPHDASLELIAAISARA
ncbi:helix-turn-helix domain-containing protein [Streptomyces sp. A7024]|uniref:Helix-turn-helix domain-containing protein n=1 Tax=Streptomyces coryli TaxID=1128680 RepID=A0A6G4TSS3_9ACTN|nr:helix-turn-helix transcriptional regulator [Streptomyces coryli]NGN62853.1 helix-turn-helix domain-containing protein [Streptomyces coryli]